MKCRLQIYTSIKRSDRMKHKLRSMAESKIYRGSAWGAYSDKILSNEGSDTYLSPKDRVRSD